MQNKKSFHKVIFRQKNSDDEIFTESVQAIRVEEKNMYKIANIPFFIRGISYNDIISVKVSGDEMLAKEIINEGGHSTVRVYVHNEKLVDDLRKQLKANGCDSEISHNPKLIAIDIPPTVDYDQIKTLLQHGEDEGKWEYEEGCIAHVIND